MRTVDRRGSQRYDVPDSAREEKRRNYPSTDIMLAFPTQADGTPNTDRKARAQPLQSPRCRDPCRAADAARVALAPQNNIFAYLPVRSFGFKFVIQADFLLVANREDSAWMGLDP